MARYRLASLIVTGFAVLFLTTVSLRAQSDDIWTPVDTGKVRRMVTESDSRLPLQFSAFKLEVSRLKVVLSQASEEFKGEPQTILELPMPNGTLARFRIEHSLVVEPGLLEKFPELGATYRGYGIDDPTASVRFDLLPSGFHAFILSSAGSILIDPQSDTKESVYLSFLKSDAVGESTFTCEVGKSGKSGFESLTRVSDKKVSDFTPEVAPEVTSGTQLRTYRLALAANAEYCSAVNSIAGVTNNVANTLAAQVLIMNRVNGIYERDLAIHMNMVANNNLVVYAPDHLCGGVACTSANDPYSNGTGALSQNTGNLNTVIGSAFYDIGHVFTTGSGGVANLAVPCGGTKGGGTTGLPAPVGDAFAIDYVAHEMGHQWGANHTFNGTVGSCNGNRSSSAAYETGSGITIMAYAGICGNQDLAPHSIDTFHVKSLEEIVTYSQTGNGNTCAVTTSTGNTAPTNITVGGPYTIPNFSPFALTASAMDNNGDTLTYDWQEYDRGGATTAVPNSDSDGTARPIFRPYLPSTSSVRYFPSLTYILNNANVPPSTYDCGRATPCLTGEIMSTMNRTMSFQVVVRDNRVGGGGINTATSAVTITNNQGPFLVTAPNTAVTFAGGSTQSVTWDVAGTTAAPVSAANVDILLSTDGGLTFPTVLAAATPNDGTQSVTIPNIATTTGRIKVQATGNIFFDISNTNFTITSSSVSVSGRVFGLGGRGIRKALVTLTPQGGGAPLAVLTSPLGFYVFPSVPAGQTYTVTAVNRRFTYTPQTLLIGSNLTNLNFTPNP